MNDFIKKLSAVVVWYNPKESDINNILSYNSFFDKIFIVDNSDNDNSHLLHNLKNVEYFPNNSNLGIAKALNTGCKKALDDGFEWIMTMDQDSSWDAETLKAFLLNICNNADNNIKSFAPKHRNEIKSLVGDIKYKLEETPETNIIFQNKVMTSGNIICLKTWQELGGFNEDLFIDEVDHEFCYRLINNNYKICEFQNIYMIHTLGYVKKTFLPRPCKHSGIRLYYIFRNMLYIKKHFPKEFKAERYNKYMTAAFIQKLFEFKFADLSFMIKGIKAYKKNRYGRY